MPNNTPSSDSGDAAALAEETNYYHEVKESLLPTAEGKFALIKGRKLVGLFDSPDKAYSEGIAQLGNVPMLIVQVKKEEAKIQIPALTLGLIRAKPSY
jgi:hypothetical protein